MAWFQLEIKERSFLAPSHQPYSLFLSPPPPLPSSQSSGFNLNDKVSPKILLVIIIIAIIFFVSGLLHLLVRFLLRPSNRDPDETDDVTALHGQLQQLFHLHDAGVDQSFIDTLPVFDYKAITGVKDPFDCAVCLCEYEAEDKLRLLPKCSHAFHMDCIDTWLLSHSTCPLCRSTLLADFSPNNNCAPIVLVLESRSETSREIVPEVELGRTNSLARVDSHLSANCDEDLRLDPVQESVEIQAKEEEEGQRAILGSEEKVLSVKLGKFRNVDGGGDEGSSDSNADARRCYSMGSFAYVMDANSSLQVPIRTPVKKQSTKNPSLPLAPGIREAMSECGCDSSRRQFNGLEDFKILEIQSGGNDGSTNAHGSENKSIGRNKKESFSVSKIWLRGRRDMPNAAATVESSRRAFSFRLPINRNPVAAEDWKVKNGMTISEISSCRWENGGSEMGCGEEVGSCSSLDSQANRPSFARRTLLWLMGKQNKVDHSSFSNNV